MNSYVVDEVRQLKVWMERRIESGTPATHSRPRVSHSHPRRGRGAIRTHGCSGFDEGRQPIRYETMLRMIRGTFAPVHSSELWKPMYERLERETPTQIEMT